VEANLIKYPFNSPSNKFLHFKFHFATPLVEEIKYIFVK
jgi:hypothetical protein